MALFLSGTSNVYIYIYGDIIKFVMDMCYYCCPKKKGVIIGVPHYLIRISIYNFTL